MTNADSIVKYIPRLRRYARALMRNNVLEADDLVQDTLERALNKLHYWRQNSDLRAWLFTIMHNIHANQVRCVVNKPQHVELKEMPELIQQNDYAETSLQLRELARAMDLLSDGHREVLLLVSVEGLSYHEVAGILNIPQGTVMSRLSRARERLRVLMSPANISKPTRPAKLEEVT